MKKAPEVYTLADIYFNIYYKKDVSRYKELCEKETLVGLTEEERNEQKELKKDLDFESKRLLLHFLLSFPLMISEQKKDLFWRYIVKKTGAITDFFKREELTDYFLSPLPFKNELQKTIFLDKKAKEELIIRLAKIILNQLGYNLSKPLISNFNRLKLFFKKESFLNSCKFNNLLKAIKKGAKEEPDEKIDILQQLGKLRKETLLYLLSALEEEKKSPFDFSLLLEKIQRVSDKLLKILKQKEFKLLEIAQATFLEKLNDFSLELATKLDEEISELDLRLGEIKGFKDLTTLLNFLKEEFPTIYSLSREFRD